MSDGWPVAPLNVSHQDPALEKATPSPAESATAVALARILIADHEELFAHSTAEQLRLEGYECDVAADADAASARLRSSEYDLLISAVRMPGNHHLEFIHELPSIAPGIPVILVTAYPSIQSAAECVQMHVAAYLTKPLDFNELLRQVRSSLGLSSFRQLVRESRRRLYEQHNHIRALQGTLASATPADPVATDDYVTLTMNQIVSGVMDLYHLTAVMADHHGAKPPCELLQCPRLNGLTDALKDSVNVLEETKRSFKSKDLGELRKRLQCTLDAIGD